MAIIARMSEREADRLARQIAETMFAREAVAQELGMEIEEVTLGRAVVSMTVTDAMLNGHFTCHGGMIFSLADTAFAYACNSGNETTVAQHCAIHFLAVGRAGDRLTAEALERSKKGRSGVYDVTVRRADGTTIAEFRGLSRTVGGPILNDEEEEKSP